MIETEEIPGSAIGKGRSRMQQLRLILMIGGVLAVLLGVFYFWITGGRYMSTDDAYLQAAQTSISSNIAGQVTAIEVHDNQRVQRGDVLFKLDQRPYLIAIVQAEAKLGTTRMQIEAGKSTYGQYLADLHSAQETLAYQQKENTRQKHLLSSGISSQAQYDQSLHALDAARQHVTAAQQQVASVVAMLGGDPAIDPDQHPAVRLAQAALDRAKLDLSYTTITAPSDGIVTKVEQLQVGDHINAASPVFALISTHDVWVEANFKEDQLAHMRPGQPATVEIDAYPDKTFKAHVSSLAPGTGSQFSALPPENATGNWVKVVQRLPARLELDDPDTSLPLHSGLSVNAEVDTGHHRHLFGADTDDQHSEIAGKQ